MGELMTNFRGLIPARMTLPVAAATLLEKKNIVGLDVNGRLVPGGTIASGCLECIGRNLTKVDNSAGAAAALDAEVELGIFEWSNSVGDPVTAADVGHVVYCEAYGIVARTSNGGLLPVAGIMTELTAEPMVAVHMSPWVAELAQAIALADAGVSLQKRSVTIVHGDLTDADTSETENIGAVLPANARILGVAMHTVTAFSGGGTGSLAVDVGTAGDVDAIVDGANLFAAAVDGQAATMPPGIAPNKFFSAAGAQLIATFVTDTTLAAFTAGAVTIDVYFAVLA